MWVDIKNIAKPECICSPTGDSLFLEIGVLRRLVVKPSFEKFVLMIFLVIFDCMA